MNIDPIDRSTSDNPVATPNETGESSVTETSDSVAERNRKSFPPSKSEVNPFEKFIGILGPFPGGEEGIKAWIDDLRNDED